MAAVAILLAERYALSDLVLSSQDVSFFPLDAPSSAFLLGRMTLSVLLVFFAFILALIVALHIPLPSGIADRAKLQLLELLLRIGNEYAGDAVESLLGENARNRWTRFIIWIAFAFQWPQPKWAKLEDRVIGGVPCRLYLPLQRKSRSAIVFIHGGGWAIMRAAYYDNIMCTLFGKLGVSIISIDYRLAPEHPYPAALDDCTNVVKAILENKEDVADLDIDAKDVCVAGDSAGGHLSTTVCLRLKKEGAKILPKCQVLIYPVTSVLTFRSSSHLKYYAECNGSALLNPRSMARWWLMYMGLPADRRHVKMLLRDEHISAETLASMRIQECLNVSTINHADFALVADQKAPKKRSDHGSSPPPKDEAFIKQVNALALAEELSPLVSENLAGLPPAIVITAGFDILRDEGALYAQRLKKAGVETEWKHYATGFHGVINMPASRLRKRIKDDMLTFIRAHISAV